MGRNRMATNVMTFCCKRIARTGARWISRALLAVLVCGTPIVAEASDYPPSFRGRSGPFKELRPLAPAPLTSFFNGKKGVLNLKRFRGKVVLLNLWATWCIPCVEELPALDRLAGDVAGEKFEIVALSIDRNWRELVTPFLDRLGIRNLAVYADPGSAAYGTLGTRGLPTTYLIDHRGRLVGYLEGQARWDSDAAKALIRHYTDRIGTGS